MEINELLQQRQEEKSQKHQKIFSNIMSGVLIAGCVYVSILIYGVMVTDYNYNENGEIVPEVVSVQDIKEEKLTIQFCINTYNADRYMKKC